MLHYADAFPELRHAELEAPFRPERYVEAIKAADAEGFPVIFIDSGSHAYAGTGGLLDWHEEELTRMAGDDWKKREALTFAAWVKPKQAQKAFVSELLRVKAHVVIALRAEEKIEIIKKDGKTIVQPKKSLVGADGWVPVCERNFAYEMTLSFLLTAGAPGIPKPIKLQEQHKPMVPLDRPLDEGVGRALAEWAAGSAPQPAAQGSPLEAVVVDAETEQQITSLSALLVAYGREKGQEGAFVAAIEANRGVHADDPAEHVAWLQAQIDRQSAAAVSA